VKRLHRFIIFSYIGPFIMTFFIALFILLMQFLWRYLDDLVGKGLEVNVILELLMYASTSLVPMALPLAILLSSIMTFGNLGEHNELMAIKSAGISLTRIMQPLIIMVIFISIGAFMFSNNVMPYTNLKMQTLLWDVRHQKPEVSVKEGVFSDAIDGYSIKVARKSHKNSMLYDIMIYDHTRNDGNRDVTTADSGTMKMTLDKRYLLLTLYNGTRYLEEVESRKRWEQREFPHEIDHFEEEQLLIDLSGLGFERSDENLFKNSYAMLNIRQLKHNKDSLNKRFQRYEDDMVKNLSKNNYFKQLNISKADSSWYSTDSLSATSFNIDTLIAHLPQFQKEHAITSAIQFARVAKSYIAGSINEFDHQSRQIKRHEIEWHRKFALSFACILLFFIGAPLGAIIRKGGLGMPVVVSVLFFVIYYVINISGEKSAKIGAWPAWLGMWLSGFVFLPLGVFLTYQATHDSTIMNVTTYFDGIKKIGSYVNKLSKKIISIIVGPFLSKKK
jgi:lipopolysaccharide export system permease protein